MTTTLLAPLSMQRFYDNNNNPLVGGQLFTYQAGTTTPVATYTDSTGSTQNPNPVVLNARGEAPIWLSPVQAYKFVLEDAAGNTIWTVDNLTSPAPVAVGNMTDEKGSGGTYGFAANVDFTPGTTTSLTLSTNYGSASNLWVTFDAAEQGADTFSLSGKILTFTAPIPVGIDKVFVKGGTALSIGTPGNATITDASVASGSKLYNRINDVVSLMDFGAIGDDVADDTAAMNAAIQYCYMTGKPLYCPTPPKAYRLTSTIMITQSVKLYGDGVQPFVDITNWNTTYATIGKGSWFHFDHAGQGFNATAATHNSAYGVEFWGIGTIRNQPTPNGTAAYVPATNDYDFYCNDVDLLLDDVFCLNPTKFSYTTGGGRAVYRRVRGQPLQYGIYTDTAYDVCRYSYIHFWPWWSVAQGVLDYTHASANAITFARNDNPMLDNIFTYAYFGGIVITSNANGNTARLKGVNIDHDYANYGLFVDGSVSGFTAMFTNYTATGTGANSNSGVFTAPGSTTSELRFENFHMSNFGSNGARIDGTSNFAWFGNAKVQQWNQSGVGFSAFDAEPNNSIYFDGKIPYCVAPGAGGTPLPFGGNGHFGGFDYRMQVVGNTDASGNVIATYNLGATPTIIQPSVQNAGGVQLTAQTVDGTANGASAAIKVFSGGAPLVSSATKVNVTLSYE